MGVVVIFKSVRDFVGEMNIPGMFLTYIDKTHSVQRGKGWRRRGDWECLSVGKQNSTGSVVVDFLHLLEYE